MNTYLLGEKILFSVGAGFEKKILQVLCADTFIFLFDWWGLAMQAKMWTSLGKSDNSIEADVWFFFSSLLIRFDYKTRCFPLHVMLPQLNSSDISE